MSFFIYIFLEMQKLRFFLKKKTLPKKFKM